MKGSEALIVAAGIAEGAYKQQINAAKVAKLIGDIQMENSHLLAAELAENLKNVYLFGAEKEKKNEQ